MDLWREAVPSIGVGQGEGAEPAKSGGDPWTVEDDQKSPVERGRIDKVNLD